MQDIPDPSSPEFDVFLDKYFDVGQQVAESME
jgi:hypothetical protein